MTSAEYLEQQNNFTNRIIKLDVGLSLLLDNVPGAYYINCAVYLYYNMLSLRT